MKEQFKETMSRLTMQAMIMTTSGMKGVTLGSVTSFSINPRPMIQFNLQVPSFTSREIHTTKKFALHLLSPRDECVNLARLFSKGAIKGTNNVFVSAKPFIALEKGKDYSIHDVAASDGQISTTLIGNSFKGKEMHYNSGCEDVNKSRRIQIPVLKLAERVLICEGIHCIQVCDHEIWIGQVEQILNPNDGSVIGNYQDEITGGLLYCNKQFRKLGQVIG
ncbi:HDL055Cp [Eremothecium sinecaudum]|uniref:HDL055Cp n=1 Tax=Eremothecium sinecaudum TaxID=45286 RepID=A0A0X8HSL3_9SACH|nr:HDL055Cp [Eremothecium sinecaudum]AMD20689.1 HDL055Cp [Eremothecium sinecaudum]